MLTASDPHNHPCRHHGARRDASRRTKTRSPLVPPRRREHQVLLAHADQISIVSPQDFSLDGNGVVKGHVDQRVVDKARQAGVKLVPLFMNPGFDQPSFHRVLTVPASWKAAMHNLTALCRDHHFDGLQFDVENVHVNDRDLFTKFVRELTDSLHRNHCTSAIAIGI